jgi:uncharacterized protein
MIKKITLAVALALSSQAYAANTEFDNFTPLTSSQVGALPAATPVLLSSPYFSQVTIADRTGSGVAGAAWDMVDSDASGRYLFTPFETAQGGVLRIDTQDTNYATRAVTIVAPGTQAFVAGDASRTTPWGGYLTAEESWGAGSTKGRLFEVTNPTTATANGGNFIQRNIIPRVSHEGLAFDAMKNLYFIDELNGGSIYKYTSANANATNGDDYFAAGQTFVAKVNGGSNANAVGNISWQAITDANGGFLAGSSVFATAAGLPAGTIDGRESANLVGGTDYQRPEDTEIVKNANGEEILYFATTTTNEVYAFNLATNTSSVFANASTIDLATGLPVTSTAFTSPDNISFDSEGNIYIIEDRNGAVDDDIWFAKDINKDGDLLDAGEGLARWASNGTPGSEFTGLYFDRNDPNKAYVNIQHPTDGNDRMIQLTATAPVPEAETYAMFLAGLGLMGFMSRRRKV